MEPLRFHISVHINRRIRQYSVHVAQEQTHFLQTLQQVGRQLVHCTTFLIASNVDNNFGISRNGIMFGPSLNARSGSGCVSINRPPQPAATAAFANTGANSLCPLDRSPAPPGNWTEWVASKITGH